MTCVMFHDITTFMEAYGADLIIRICNFVRIHIYNEFYRSNVCTIWSASSEQPLGHLGHNNLLDSPDLAVLAV